MYDCRAKVVYRLTGKGLLTRRCVGTPISGASRNRHDLFFIDHALAAANARGKMERRADYHCMGPLKEHLSVPRRRRRARSAGSGPWSSGFAIAMVGLAMCVTILMFPGGVTLGLIGLAVWVCYLSTPPLSTHA